MYNTYFCQILSLYSAWPPSHTSSRHNHTITCTCRERCQESEQWRAISAASEENSRSLWLRPEGGGVREEGGRERGREGREGEREGGREEGREGEREGGREGGEMGGREGQREKIQPQG